MKTKISKKKPAIKLKWVENIKESLYHYPAPILKEYLNQFGLRKNDARKFLIDRIIHAALIAEKLQGNDQKRLRRKIPMPVGQEFIALNTKIGSLLKKREKTPDFKELVNYIDEFAENGRQYIFLYRINPKHMGYLDNLKEEDYIRKLLRNVRCGTYYNKKNLVWEYKTPKLAEVRHRYKSGEGILLFKWIETRHWKKNISGALSPRLIHCQERSVNFFRVDLKEGAAEIRIQMLNTFPRKSLQEELKIYINEIRKFLNFDYFLPVPFEPVIKKLLKSNIMKIKSWNIGLPDGGILAGIGGPNLFNRLKLGFRNYLGRKITVEWRNLKRTWGPESVLTKFDGNLNVLLITKYCDTLQIEFILEWLKKFKLKQIKIPEIRELAEKRNDLELILRSIDQILVQSKNKRVSSYQLESLWYRISLIKSTYKELVKVSSKKFKISMEKGKPVLVYKPSIGLIGFLEDKFGMEFSEVQKRAVIAIAFMIVIILLSWLNIKLFFPLINESNERFVKFFVTLTCFINIILIFAISIPIIGRERIRDAIEFITKIIKGMKRLFPSI